VSAALPEIRGLDTETGEPKYARVEYERHWLVDRAARPPVGEAYMTQIEDRYIDGTRMRLRRMSRPDLNEIKWKLTKKYACEEACARPIVTTYLTEPEYDLLRQLPAHALAKRRYHLPFEGRWWSLDVFEDALEGLELIECEADDRASLAALIPPPWAGREITDMDQWQGGALAATQPIPED
jgi:CYTH domain-containing protein